MDITNDKAGFLYEIKKHRTEIGYKLANDSYLV